MTAGLAVAGYAEIPITHGQSASAVALVTGHQRREKAQPPLDYAALAAFPGTLIFYMGVTSAAEWSAALIAGGRAADTPVAIVRRCTWADQETFRSTLATVAEAVAAQKIRPPAIFVVGEVVNLAPAISWFAARPLCGVRVLVTRPGEQVHDLRDRLWRPWGPRCWRSRASRSGRRRIGPRSMRPLGGWTATIGWSFPAATASAICWIGYWPWGAICGGWAG